MAFYVGMRVVCVDAKPRPGCAWIVWGPPVEGTVYTVVQTGLQSRHGECIRIAEMDGQYLRERFRPVVERPTSIEIFKRMLVPSEREKAGA